MIFVDTNIFLRFVLKDNLQQYKEARQLLRKGAGREVELFTSTVAIFEVYWVLKSFYQKNREEISKILRQILSFGYISIDNKAALSFAVEYYSKTSFDLADCFHLFYAQENKAGKFATFDEKLQRVFAKLNVKG